jgi:hypothetical protein
MEGLIDLLQHADDKPVPACHLSGLLTPLHRQVQYVNSETRHLRYELLDDIRACPVAALSTMLLTGGNTGSRPLSG